MRLDHLQALVQHRGRIDRDLAAHAPVGMGAGLRGRDVVQVFEVATAERAARGGEQQAAHAGRRRVGRARPATVRHALENGIVFAVDRQ